MHRYSLFVRKGLAFVQSGFIVSQFFFYDKKSFIWSLWILLIFAALCQRLQDLNEQYHSSRARLSESISSAVKKREEVEDIAVQWLCHSFWSFSEYIYWSKSCLMFTIGIKWFLLISAVLRPTGPTCKGIRQNLTNGYAQYCIMVMELWNLWLSGKGQIAMGV